MKDKKNLQQVQWSASLLQGERGGYDNGKATPTVSAQKKIRRREGNVGEAYTETTVEANYIFQGSEFQGGG